MASTSFCTWRQDAKRPLPLMGLPGLFQRRAPPFRRFFDKNPEKTLTRRAVHSIMEGTRFRQRRGGHTGARLPRPGEESAL